MHKVRRRYLKLFKGQEYNFQIYVGGDSNITYFWNFNGKPLRVNSSSVTFLPDTLVEAEAPYYDTLTCFVFNGVAQSEITWYLSLSFSDQQFRIKIDRDTFIARAGDHINFQYEIAGDYTDGVSKRINLRLMV